jgi:RNA:NAD 2'-phosphotransferase (TPT1/KptA family)
MDREWISISKFLSLVTRHRPEAMGISLDEQGWVEIKSTPKQSVVEVRLKRSGSSLPLPR